MIKTIYNAFETTSENGTLGKCLGRSYDKAVAEHLAKGNGFFGSDGRVTEGSVLITADGVYLLSRPEPIPEEEIKDAQVIRDAALAKLTDEERKALGV
jgi:hypothetical protein